jgi:hypothetical protein
MASIMDCAEMVKFGNLGSDATGGGAVRLARAATGREAATRESIRRHATPGVIEMHYEKGTEPTQEIESVVGDHNIEECLGVSGRPCNPVFFTRDARGRRSRRSRPLLIQALQQPGLGLRPGRQAAGRPEA